MNCDSNCKNCKHQNSCILLQPIKDKQHLLLVNEIGYWNNQLRQARRNIHDYESIVSEINQYHKYSIPVNVYGNIQYAPKKNAFCVFIKRPEHVFYGWNLNKLQNKEKEILEKLRDLQMTELNIRRELS